MASPSVNQLPLAPLGAGDLIDRAVRLYRRNFMPLIRIAAPPVVVSAIGSILWTVGWREVFTASSETGVVLYILTIIASAFIIIAGYLFSLIVMGGAARNLVTHILWHEPVSARATYRNVRQRFWSLFLAAIINFGIMFIVGFFLFFIWYMGFFVVVFGSVAIGQVAPVWVAASLGLLVAVAITFVVLWIFFWVAGKLAYVPQVMLVEGRTVIDAVVRSFRLAHGNARRLMAMVFFSSFAAWSALMILVIPLGLFGYTQGVNPLTFDTQAPAWYTIGYSVLRELSAILLLPVWMLGLSLLYVDERVRHEGYDVELMAARVLGEIPKLSQDISASYTPALVEGLATAEQSYHDTTPMRPPSTLGLS